MSAEETLSEDLIIDIFSRLPSKSIARFRCLSKQWASTLAPGSSYFTELFLTQSTTRPRLLFAVKCNDKKWWLYSCHEPQISYKNSESSLSVTAEFHMSLPKSRSLHINAPILGLFYCSNLLDYDGPLLCNPSTKKLLLLPELPRPSHSYFGYDPIDKQFSVLSIASHLYSHGDRLYQILNLGSERLSWRNIECPLDHEYYAVGANICINGVLYYIARCRIDRSQKIVCFDLNSEEFKFIDVPWPVYHERLVNFKGKLGGIRMRCVQSGEERFDLKLTLWVLEDAEKQEWSKHKYLLPSNLWDGIYPDDFYIVGMTTKGEVVLSFCLMTVTPLYYYFFSLEKNILRKLEIKGFEKHKFRRRVLEGHHLQGCVDYVEGLKGLN